jgi:hypothetical protein
MEATSSEMSVDFQRTTRRYIPEDSTLHRRLFDKIKEEEEEEDEEGDEEKNAKYVQGPPYSAGKSNEKP